MAQPPQNAFVSTHPPPPKRFYHNCAATRPTPPPPPTSATYTMFGRVYATENVPASLKDANCDELFDADAPPITELRRLNTLLLQRFLRLVDVLCRPSALTFAPDGMPLGPHDDLVREINAVLANMQFLLNALRPAQAAHDLRALLLRQTAARRTMADRLRAAVQQSWDLVADAADKLADPSDALPPDSAGAVAIARAAVAAAPAARPRAGDAVDAGDAAAAANGIAGVSVTDAAMPDAAAAKRWSRRAGLDDDDDAADDDDPEVGDRDDADDEGLVPLPARPPPEQLAAQLAHIMRDPSL